MQGSYPLWSPLKKVERPAGGILIPLTRGPKWCVLYKVVRYCMRLDGVRFVAGCLLGYRQ